jgi:hypothetical protein
MELPRLLVVDAGDKGDLAVELSGHVRFIPSRQLIVTFSS